MLDSGLNPLFPGRIPIERKRTEMFEQALRRLAPATLAPQGKGPVHYFTLHYITLHSPTLNGLVYLVTEEI